MSGEYHRGGNPANEVDSDQDNEAAPSSGRAPPRRLELSSPQGSAKVSRKRSRRQREDAYQLNIQPRTADGQQVLPQPYSPPRLAAQGVGRAEAAPPDPVHHRSQSTALLPDLRSQPTPALPPALDFFILDPRFPLTEVFQTVSQHSAPAETSPSYSLNFSPSLLNSNTLHLAMDPRSSRSINQQEVFSIHPNITIGLTDGTGRWKEYRGVMASGLPITIIHVSTAEQLGWSPDDLPPISIRPYYVQGMGSITPRKWLYAPVKLPNFEGIKDLYVASDDYPPFPFVLLEDNSLGPLGSRPDQPEHMTSSAPHAQPGSELQLGQLDHAASTLYAAPTHGGRTTDNTTFYAPSDNSLSYGPDSSEVTDFIIDAGREGHVSWMPTAATTLPPAQPESKASQHDGTMAMPHADFYGPSRPRRRRLR